MKTSNKLLTLLVSSIFIITSAVFFDIRVFGVHKSEDNRPKKTYNENISEYRHLVVDNVRYFEIKPSEHNHLNFTLFNDTIEWGMNYRVVNDTLFIIGKQNAKHSSYWLYTASEIESISVINSNVELSGINYKKLVVDVKDGQVNNYRNESSVNTLSLSEVDSKVYLNNCKVDTLYADMLSSHARFNKEIDIIKADLKKESELSVKNLTDINLTKDASSHLRIY